MPEIPISPLTAVKTLTPEGRIGGYLAVWGSADQRDLHGEYFTPETDFGLDWYPFRPVLYHHAQDAAIKMMALGVIDTLRADDVGLWAEAQLEKRNKYVAAVLRLVERGALSWSSGSLPSLVKSMPDGRITRWVIVEGSLTPTPAEPRLTDVRALKAALNALREPDTDAAPDADRAPQSASTHEPLPHSDVPTTQGAFPMDDFAVSATPRKRLPSAVEEAAKSAWIEVGSPYDQLEALDLLHGCLLLNGARSSKGVSERYANALAHKVRKAGLSAVKADELSSTAQSGFGADWVPTLWSAQIWAKARQENVILPLFNGLEMPSNPFNVPIEGADPTVYYVPETRSESQLTLGGSGAAIIDDKLSSAKITLTAQKLALRVGFSAELVEDAVLPVLNIYRQQAVRAIADAIDSVLLNGDTTTGGGNINDDDASLSDSEAFLAFNGLRHLPLVANTANRLDFASAPTLEKMRTTRFKMQARYAAKPTDLAWIVNHTKKCDHYSVEYRGLSPRLARRV
ncbi:MAG: phage major capsid protein [Chloroflexi bacterium]|nr:phage major capsid protein [Chloroflexota bacterium]